MSKHTSESICPSCEEKLKLAKQELIDWFHDLKARNLSCHVSWTYRDQASQEDAIATGHSKLHFPQSAHNKMPAEAVDIFQINDKGQATWDPIFCAKVAQEIKDANLPIIWGGVFKSIGDADHFQYHTDT